MKLLSLAILVCCLAPELVRAAAMSAADPESVGLSSERLERFSAAMQKGIKAGHFPGAVAAVARNGKVVFFESYGSRDKAAGLPMTDDAIFRIASMTKAITGVAVMILFEEGHFTLQDPVSRFVPAFKTARVLVRNSEADAKGASTKKEDWTEHQLKQWLTENWESLSKEDQDKWLALYYEKAKAAPENAETERLKRPITIRDLLRHTAGITYNMGEIWVEGDDLGQMIDKLAAQPLKSQPGTRFEYGLSMDVLARLVEVVSGQSFDDFIKDRILDPLAMKDTGFYVPKDHANRLVKMPESGAGKGKGKQKGKASYSEDSYLSPPLVLAGGSGLVSTTMDYLRFCQMLLNNGELGGKRILGRKAVELMHANHMNDVAEKSTGKEGAGEFLFGLTFGVYDKPGNTGKLTSQGSYYWGGAYGTSFWIDPHENLVGVFMVNGLSDSDEKNYDMPYSQMLEHFTYQAIVE